MNTKNLLLLASLVFAMPLSAQSPLEDFKRDITLSDLFLPTDSI